MPVLGDSGKRAGRLARILALTNFRGDGSLHARGYLPCHTLAQVSANCGKLHFSYGDIMRPVLIFLLTPLSRLPAPWQTIA